MQRTDPTKSDVSVRVNNLSIREKAVGREHPDLVEVLEDYADLLHEMGRSGEADELEDRARAIRNTQP